MLETRDLRTATGGPLGVVNRSFRGDTPEDKGSDVGAWGHRNRSQEAASARPGGSGAALSKPRLRSHGANRSALEGDGAEPRGLRLRGFEASGLKLAGCDGGGSGAGAQGLQGHGGRACGLRLATPAAPAAILQVSIRDLLLDRVAQVAEHIDACLVFEALREERVEGWGLKDERRATYGTVRRSLKNSSRFSHVHHRRPRNPRQ